MKPLKLLTVVGARPQFIKASAVSRAIKGRTDIVEVLVHTGQHHDVEMSQVFFDELELPQPRFDLGIHGGTHGSMTGRMLEALDQVLISEKPDWVLVYGDTNSTLAGALSAAKLNIPVAHVEAGLRSFNRTMPEEINRILVDQLSSLLFCPTYTAVDNLKAEGRSSGVHHVGDVMYDCVKHLTKERALPQLVVDVGLASGQYSVVTIHRAANTDSPAAMSTIIEFLQELPDSRPLLWPVHPRLKRDVLNSGVRPGRFIFCDPVGYLDMQAILSNCHEVFTDSGGLQKEAYFHGKECTTLRDETEWPETIASGWNRLWSQDRTTPKRTITEFGVGRTSEEILDIMVKSS